MNCARCGASLRGEDFRAFSRGPDCHPLCPACAARTGSAPAGPGRRTLLRERYAAGRSLSRCDTCHAENPALEFHWLVPSHAGGQPAGANLLLVCRDCHDRLHLGARLMVRRKAGAPPLEEEESHDGR